MPYWVEQVRGPHITAIKKIVSQYKAGNLKPETAYRRLDDLYAVSHSGKRSLTWEEISERGEWDVNHHIMIHLPFYANHWTSDWNDREAEARRFERQYPGTTFGVGYEY